MADEYIRREDAVDDLHTQLMYRMGSDDMKRRLDDWVKTLPSADVVQVVRCKDCKYWDDTEAEPLCEVLYDGDGVMYSPEPDDFCSYGEKREE